MTPVSWVGYMGDDDILQSPGGCLKKVGPKTRYKWSEITPMRREINPSETQLFSAIYRG